ncbi:MAG TPA: hypothetical protein VNV85_08590 [Puia sp.]|jgi:hypothetical protein|nr:hypothetical protein [Puia sp.]
MKTSIATILFLLINLFAFSQDRSSPPKSVRESFQKSYPQSQPTRWDHNSGGWSAVFDDKDHNDGEATAHFDSRGRHVDTHIAYDNADVPTPVVDNLRRKYQGSDNYEFTRIDHPGGGAVFQAKFTHQTKRRTRYFDQTGNEKDYHDRH